MIIVGERKNIDRTVKPPIKRTKIMLIHKTNIPSVCMYITASNHVIRNIYNTTKMSTKDSHFRRV